VAEPSQQAGAVVSVTPNLVQWVLLGGILLINTFPQSCWSASSCSR
jgi:hypothetical protein